jgi:hypothetical protein
VAVPHLASRDLAARAPAAGLVVEPALSSRSTHLVLPVEPPLGNCMRAVPRTADVLEALCRGLPVVDLAWLDACVRAGGPVDVGEYRVTDILRGDDDVEEPVAGARAALLRGQSFVLLGPFVPTGGGMLPLRVLSFVLKCSSERARLGGLPGFTQSRLQSLVELCGGRVVREEVADGSEVILMDEDQGLSQVPTDLCEGDVRRVDWLIDSIAKGLCLPKDGFTVKRSPLGVVE